MQLSMRPLTPEDTAEIWQVLQDDGGYCRRVEGRDPRQADAAALLTAVPPGVPADRLHVQGIFDGTQLLGLAVVVDGWPDAESAYIGLLQVKASLQGKGLGALLHRAVRWTLPQAQRWMLSVVDTNDGAVGFWEGQGYRRTSDVPWRNDAGDEHTAYRMEAEPGPWWAPDEPMLIQEAAELTEMLRTDPTMAELRAQLHHRGFDPSSGALGGLQETDAGDSYLALADARGEVWYAEALDDVITVFERRGVELVRPDFPAIDAALRSVAGA